MVILGILSAPLGNGKSTWDPLSDTAILTLQLYFNLIQLKCDLHYVCGLSRIKICQGGIYFHD